jgi:hypothetical protein
MPFRIFAYSSNISKANFDLMESWRPSVCCRVDFMVVYIVRGGTVPDGGVVRGGTVPHCEGRDSSPTGVCGVWRFQIRVRRWCRMVIRVYHSVGENRE